MRYGKILFCVGNASSHVKFLTKLYELLPQRAAYEKSAITFEQAKR